MQRILIMLITLGFSATAVTHVEPPSTAQDLRSGFASLNAVPGAPDSFKVNFFNDQQVLLRSITVEPTGVPESGGCRVLVRINNLLSKVLYVQPPGAAGSSEPPGQWSTLTWKALLERVGVDQPLEAIVFTPEDSLLVTLESVSGDAKDTMCSANVLALGSVYSDDLVGNITPIDPDDLRSEFFSLDATPGDPEEYVMTDMNDVLVSSYQVVPTRRSEIGKCLITARINELLASIRTIEPRIAIVEIQEPPSGIVFTPNDLLKVKLESVPTGKDKNKEKGGTCSAEVLLFGRKYSNGE
jgi:hypothetical protein